MRELVSGLQKQRKDTGLAVSDRIKVEVLTQSAELTAMLKEHDVRIREEVLAVTVSSGEVMDFDGHDHGYGQQARLERKALGKAGSAVA